ncbi:transglycosylase family protein [Streptomyces spiramenti]|uniref:LysM peptidoglycan-binding domain-containing protein n=1 Tax=Streptomyces spiramenti TaxID=2720606 RepID=A0ABX1APV4_9ACTN|nr:transglycosylase family protein [Streptomyces spiramenti]NJP68176.1 LysM peptidoglycan-binding domain-containing protein [Streptomyces spiramenti]
MLSGNGRHRRPKQAPAFLVTAGVAGASAALPLLGAGAAHAVGGETWDRVAECESDGDWNADSGNGYYGGLQLPLSTWAEFGGEEFADRPDLASRSQQITVAERILEDRGPRAAFPVCALSSGLTAEHRADRLAGPAPADEADDTEGAGRDSLGRFEDGEPAGARSVAPDTTDDERSDRADRSGTKESVEERSDADTGSGDRATDRAEDERGNGGRHRGSPDPDETERSEPTGGGRHSAEDRADDQPSAGGGAAKGTGSDDGATDRTEDERGDGDGDRDEDASTEDATGAGDGTDGEGYEVRPGDSLSGIAGQLGVDGGWAALYEANSGTVGENPDHILPGQLLALTPAEQAEQAAEEAEAAAAAEKTEKTAKGSGK